MEGGGRGVVDGVLRHRPLVAVFPVHGSLNPKIDKPHSVSVLRDF